MISTTCDDENNDRSIVIVTGGTSFIGSHIIYQLLNKNYYVRCTVRCLNDNKTQALLKFPKASTHLEIVQADLIDFTSWEKVRNIYFDIHLYIYYINYKFMISNIL